MNISANTPTHFPPSGSLHPDSLHRSTVFSHVVRSVFLSGAGLLLLLWLSYALASWYSYQQVESDIAEQAENFRAAFADKGIEQVIDYVKLDGREKAVWEADWVGGLLTGEDEIYQINHVERGIIGGLQAIDSGEGWDETQLDDAFGLLEERPLLAYRFFLDEGLTDMTIARVLPLPMGIAPEQLLEASLWFVLSVMLIALLSGLYTSRSVLKRLTAMTSITKQIDTDHLESRIPLTARYDEFDRLAQGVNDMVSRMNTLTQNLKNVSSGAAHDLQTPVANLSGRLQLMARDLSDPDTLENHLEQAHVHIDTLQRTLNALLLLGEIESGVQRRSFTAVDLSEMALELSESMQPVFEEADKQLAIKIEPSLQVMGNADLLKQLLLNLLVNAMKHSRDGAHAWITVAKIDGNCRIEVGDDGPGIPATSTNVVFERFHRLDASRGSSGNGLGLSLVRAIAELHEGRVRLAASSPGAVFRADIPVFIALNEDHQS
ncbi:MAG: sensor histidine kinase [Thiolinea sp.]